jgi:HAD superfamily hydrolase (TIGR01509 family)
MNRSVSDEEANFLGEQKEAVYRVVYSKHIEMVEGLEGFLQKIIARQKLTAVATSAPLSNLDFILDNLNLRSYFHCLTNSSDVARAKPDPEIYLKTAEKLNVHPSDCVVFEDSVSGIMSAKNAGMKVIALLTTHSRDELPETKLYIKNFNDPVLADFLNQNQ